MFQDHSASATIPFPESRPTALAEITPVPRSDAKVVLSPTNVAIATALILLPAGLGLVGGVGLIALGLSLANVNQAITAGCMLGGIGWGVLCILVLLRHQHYVANNYQARVARTAFERRTGGVVNPGDANARFVEILPRSSFAKWGPAADIGFLAIDAANRQLLLEGDAKRYVMPADSIVSCEVESVQLESDQWGADQYFVVVLTVNTDSGIRELPLANKPLTFASRRMAERQAEAEELCEEICGALGR
jgi:hypothetical protein